MSRASIIKELEAQGATVTRVGTHNHLRVAYRGKQIVISTAAFPPSTIEMRRWHLSRMGLVL